MRVWPIPEGIRPSITPLPPMYAWPPSIKRFILLLATGACLGVYLLLIASLLGVSLLWFS
jgi:hypothetical protein